MANAQDKFLSPAGFPCQSGKHGEEHSYRAGLDTISETRTHV